MGKKNKETDKKNKKKKRAYKKFPDRIVANRGFNTPKELLLSRGEAGIFFGNDDKAKSDHYIGMPQGTDGNIMVVGGNGSGKSTGIIKPTLENWQGAICATDIKGELSEHYMKMLQKRA